MAHGDINGRVVHDEEEPLISPQEEHPDPNEPQAVKVTRNLGRFTRPISTAVGLVLIAIFAGLAIYNVVNRGQGKPPPGTGNDSDNSKHLIVAEHGAVACDVKECSDIGVNIMKYKGGNAVDAAIATTLCIGTINMFASGIGGGGFMVIRHENGTSKSINFRESAPANATKNMYKHDPKAAQYGGLAVGVPGEIAGFQAAWELYGLTAWADLFKPSIKLSEEGFKVTDRMSKMMGYAAPFFKEQGPKGDWGFMFKDDGSGDLLELGETVKRPAFGKTLRKIAKNGPRAFYEGEVAEALVKYTQDEGGVLTDQDMKGYYAEVTDTLKTWAFGKEILTCPAPCSGPVLIEGLNIAEGLDMTDGDSPVTIHRIIETMKWLSAGRTELGDPFDKKAFNTKRVEEIQTKDFAASVRRNISDDTTFSWQHYNPSYEFVEAPGTSHISVLDEAGMAVSITSTVNLPWGARLCDPITGIVLNGEMDDFSIPYTDNAFHLKPSIYNYIKPGKRPLSSCAPTITVENGHASLIVGGSGGSYIVTSTFLCIVKLYKWGYSLLDTIASPRVHHQLIPEMVFAESGIHEDILQGLRDRGHTVVSDTGGSVVQGIHKKDDGSIDAVADWWRKGGVAAGY